MFHGHPGRRSASHHDQVRAGPSRSQVTDRLQGSGGGWHMQAGGQKFVVYSSRRSGLIGLVRADERNHLGRITFP